MKRKDREDEKMKRERDRKRGEQKFL